MIRRCYDNNLKECHNYLEGSCTCEEWHCFQNFAKWFDENYYEVPNEKMQLDKDILMKGNKIYSPDTCCFVPHTINSMLTNKRQYRGDEPLGTYKRKDSRYYEVKCMDTLNKVRIDLGSYKSKEEAFLIYKTFKENNIKNVAEYYKEYIPYEVYESLCSWDIDIND